MIEHDLLILLQRKLADATEILDDFEEGGDLEDKLHAASEHADLQDAVIMMKAVMDKLTWFREKVTEADHLIKDAALEIMDTDQLSSWKGVRAWIESYSVSEMVNETHNSVLDGKIPPNTD